MQAQNRMKNEKPSKLSNLGQDIPGAVRHNFDTYDNPEKKREREIAKAKKNDKLELKTCTIETINSCEDLTLVIEILQNYELLSAIASEKFPGYNPDGAPDMAELKAYIMAKRSEMLAARYDKELSAQFNAMASNYNRLSRARAKIKAFSWRSNGLELAKEYLAPKTKNSFKEFNGIEKDWKLPDLGPFKTYNIESAKTFLAENAKAVQFGNSLTLDEREYCLQNLKESIELLNEKYSFDFKKLGFSFGARGKPGSIAHYQDSLKVLAFNRGWSGAFIHELGHAVDYALNLPSSYFPRELRSKYRAKISKLDLGPYAAYYMGEKEIFARLFEVYMREEFPGMSDFMQFTYSEAVMPDLCDASRAWIENALKPLKTIKE